MQNHLVLGTAQLGMGYGINNAKGVLRYEDALGIVQTAWNQGVRDFDTAQGYGQSEAFLGRAFTQIGASRQARVFTKIDFKLDLLDKRDITCAVNTSLKRLNCPSIFGLMLHDENLLDRWNKKSALILKPLLASGKVRHLGVSVYTPARALQALESEDFDFVQLPSNVLDRRFENAGVFKRAEGLGKDIYIRSIFLQGLLLMRPEVKENMLFAKEFLVRFRHLTRAMGLTPLQLCIHYVRKRWPRAWMIFGAETAVQVQENLEASSGRLNAFCVREIEREFSDMPERLLNPGYWPRS